jgi:hypothetical protein
MDFTAFVSWFAIAGVVAVQLSYLRSPQRRAGQSQAPSSIWSSVALVALSLSNILRIQLGAPPIIWLGLIVVGLLAGAWGLWRSTSLQRLSTTMRRGSSAPLETPLPEAPSTRTPLTVEEAADLDR